MFKAKKSIALVLILTVLFTMTSISAFATDTAPEADAEANSTEQVQNDTNEITDANDAATLDEEYVITPAALVASATPNCYDLTVYSNLELTVLKAQLAGVEPAVPVYAEQPGQLEGEQYVYVIKGLEKAKAYELYTSDEAGAVPATSVFTSVIKVVTKAAPYAGPATISWDWDASATVLEGAALYANGTSLSLKSAKVSNGVASITYKSTLTSGTTYSFVVECNGVKSVASAAVKYYKAPAKVQNLKLYSDFKSIRLKWDKVSTASGYLIYRYNATKKKYVVVKTITSGSTTSWRDTGRAVGKKYYYYVRAYRNVKSNYGLRSEKKNEMSVRPIHYDVYLKTARTLTCHCKGHSYTHTFPANYHVDSYAFSGGKYIFDYTDKSGKTHTFYVARLSTKNQSADYTTKFNYSITEAENYVNHRGLTSKTKYLMWCSYYTQHLYIFKNVGTKSNPKWDYIKGCECSSGKSWAPSPSGVKEIWQKLAERHDVSWWSSFSSWNSFHGKMSNWPLGVPKSSGCVRLSNSDAKWVYLNSNIPIGTTCLCY